MKRIIALLSSFIFFASPLHAAIEPPYKSIDYCYRIDNIGAFPDFVVFARIPAVFGGEITDPVQLKEGECYVRNTRDEIVAVRKELFRASESAYRDVELKDSVSNSGIRTPVSPVKIYDPQDPRKKIEDIFTIDVLDDQTFSLRLAKKIVERDNGTVEEKVYATAEEGSADPPGPGYEYTDDFEKGVAYTEPEEENDGINIILPVLTFALYIYATAALFTLALRFNIRHRWRAWIPLANIHLLVETAGRPVRWFWIMLGILIGGLVVILNGFLFAVFLRGALVPESTTGNSEFAGVAYYAMPLLLFGIIVPIAFYLFELVFFVRILSSLAIRCGRPWWWCPLMILVPPVGLVLLGIMAWSKNSHQSLSVNT